MLLLCMYIFHPPNSKLQDLTPPMLWHNLMEPRKVMIIVDQIACFCLSLCQNFSALHSFFLSCMLIVNSVVSWHHCRIVRLHFKTWYEASTDITSFCQN